LQGAVDQNSRCVCQSIWKVVCKVATKHMYLIDHCADDNQPLIGRTAQRCEIGECAYTGHSMKSRDVCFVGGQKTRKCRGLALTAPASKPGRAQGRFNSGTLSRHLASSWQAIRR
jgi:hypothetical protein